MAIRLSGAQVTRIQEALAFYEDGAKGKWDSRGIPMHLRTEDLVEDILKEVLPDELERIKHPMYQMNLDGTVRRIP